jgi:arsenical-resistance protein 2
MTTQATSPTAGAEQPWYAAYPEAKSSPEFIDRSKVLELLKQGKEGEKIVLVDLRRTDYEVSHLMQDSFAT